MASSWYFLEGDQDRGPMSLEDLIRSLLAKPYPHNVLVWHDGMSDWQPAGTVPELRDRLPPAFAKPAAEEPVPFAKAEQIAKHFRRLVIFVGLQLFCSVVLQILLAMPEHSLLQALVLLAVSIGSLTLVVAISITAYRLAGPLEIGPPVLWAIFMFIPCVNILGLLILSVQAQSWCKRYGIKVGLLGPTKKSIEEVRRLTTTSVFD